MIKVQDKNGNEIPGLFRTQTGSIVVRDKNSYDRYLLERNSRMTDKNKIESLEDQVRNLTSLVEKLLNDKK